GDIRRAADRARRRRRCRVAPATWRLGGRRPPAVPVPDALYYAGRVPLPRQARPPAAAPPRAAGRPSGRVRGAACRCGGVNVPPCSMRAAAFIAGPSSWAMTATPAMSPQGPHVEVVVRRSWVSTAVGQTAGVTPALFLQTSP